jgi:oligopeptide transport system permease protein
MLAYTIRKLLTLLPILFAVVTLTFCMLKIVPGDPFTSGRALPPQIEKNLRAAYGLDQPVLTQYQNYLWNVMQGNLGPSYRVQDFTVKELLSQTLPVSILLGSVAFLLSLLLGIGLATVSASRVPLSAFTLSLCTLAGLALPSFVVGPLLQLTFGLKLRLLPVAGWDAADVRTWIMPVLTLALLPTAHISRITQGSLSEVLQADYIRAAVGRGVPGHVILGRHALRVAMIPVVASLPIIVASLITGSLVVEQVFGVPGTGRMFIQSALDHDYTVVMGLVIVMTTVILVLNAVSDIVSAVLDPRARVWEGGD